jgi:hypothetical protein
MIDLHSGTQVPIDRAQGGDEAARQKPDVSVGSIDPGEQIRTRRMILPGNPIPWRARMVNDRP